MAQGVLRNIKEMSYTFTKYIDRQYPFLQLIQLSSLYIS